LPCPHDGLFGNPKDIIATTPEAFGQGEDFLMAGASRYTTFNARHLGSPLRVGHHGADVLDIGWMHSEGSAELALVLGGALGQDMPFGGMSALDRPASTGNEPLGSGFFCLHFGHGLLL
jgi:hypothetical protein